MEEHPEGKKHYILCHCRSHDCGAQTWERKDGTTAQGKWCHKSTVTTHRKQDAALVADGSLPPAQNEVPETPAPAATEYKPPRALGVVRDDILQEEGTG
ncbi:hypothetical protein C8J57DRAFT_1498244 [Mycena rebaudengoi]|nr:hypothetical protein C8J57DRAFT_1498244 [Mycena rebaudengoi]